MLAGDIGGTKVLLALYAFVDCRPTRIRDACYAEARIAEIAVRQI